jgi:tRNA modification GTPase
MLDNSTIFALATPPGMGAISMIRLNGIDAFKIGEEIVNFKNPNKKLSTQKANTVHYCYIIDNNEVIDDVLICLFKNPNSYTGEDLIEISCHGSVYIQQKIMELLVKKGARIAQPGEFTLRAFMNGKMDLSQAEAVADLIASQSKASHDMAIHQMRGGFSAELKNLRDRLLHFISLIELELDFSEEEVEFADRNDLHQIITEIVDMISRLTQSFELGNVIKNGIPVAIVGKPNVGKSTLLNSLLNEEKAIVSEIPGTTRDIIEDTINLHGVSFRFIDTAGIRETTDTIETLGIERTFQNIEKATVILLINNVNDPIEEVENQIDKIEVKVNQHIALLVNKIDKYPFDEFKPAWDELSKRKNLKTFYISAKKHINLQELVNYLVSTVNIRPVSDNDVIVTNIRHFEALEAAGKAGERVLEGLHNKITGDLLAQDIREMLHYLGTITGEITTDEILGNIFKNFCIGK